MPKFGDILKELRGGSGKSYQELAWAMSKTVHEINYFESLAEVNSLPRTTLNSIAAALNVSIIDFFPSPDNPKLHFLYRSEDESYFPFAKQKHIERIISDYQRIENITQSYMSHIEKEERKNKERSELIKVASKIRDWLAVDRTGPLHQPLEKIERQNVRIFVSPLARSISGFTALSPDSTPTIFVNKNIDSGARRNITAIHELVHIFMHSNCSNEDYNPIVSSDDEYEANYVAGCVLYPGEDVVNTLAMYDPKKIPDKAFLTISETYGISNRTIIMRSIQEKIIDEDDAEIYYRKIESGSLQQYPKMQQYILSRQRELVEKLICGPNRTSVSLEWCAEVLDVNANTLSGIVRHGEAHNVDC